MRELDPCAAILRREADLDQLLLLGRQPDDPGKDETMRRVIGQHGSPRRFAPIGRTFEDAPPARSSIAQSTGSGPVWTRASGHQRAKSAVTRLLAVAAGLPVSCRGSRRF
jgi:hypothetical protein